MTSSLSSVTSAQRVSSSQRASVDPLLTAVKLGRWQEAGAIVQKFATAPHDRGTAQQLLQLLAQGDKTVLAKLGAAAQVDLGAVATEARKQFKVLRTSSPSTKDLAAASADSSKLQNLLLQKYVQGALRSDQQALFNTLVQSAPTPADWNAAANRAFDKSFLASLSSTQKRKLEGWVLRSLPALPATVRPLADNGAVDRAVAAYVKGGRKGYPHDVIIVPGYTPLDAKSPVKLHAIAQKRLDVAIAAYQEGKAPFILVSGANVYPANTPHYEAIEMKRYLMEKGIPADRIVVDARARHSTTNLRNAGRYMLDHGLTSGLILTTGAQDFYFSHPNLSTFHGRSEKELGYRVGELRNAGKNGSTFIPSRNVHSIDVSNPLDP